MMQSESSNQGWSFFWLWVVWIALIVSSSSPVGILPAVLALEEDKLTRQLILDLASEGFGRREEATRRPRRLGKTAEEPLRAALADAPEPEVRARLRDLLDEILADRIRAVEIHEVLDFRVLGGASRHVAASPGGKRLALSGELGAVTVLETAALETAALETIAEVDRKTIFRAALSPDGRHLALTDGVRVRLFGIRT